MLLPFKDNNPTTRTPVVTCTLIVINLIALIWMSTLPDRMRFEAELQYGFVPKRIEQLFDPNLVIDVALANQRMVVIRGEVVPIQLPADHVLLHPIPHQIAATLVTMMFFHGGWMHLIGNMLYLWVFGNSVENRLGAVPFFVFYIVGGVLASLCHWVAQPASTVPVIGASGAVAAVLGAYAITFPLSRIRLLLFLIIFVTIIELPAWLVLGVWFGFQLFDALQDTIDVGGGVAWWAHVGGFVAGLALMPVFCSIPRSPRHDSEDDRSDGLPSRAARDAFEVDGD